MPGPYSAVVLAASGLVKTGPGVIAAITLTGGSDAATLTLYDNVSAAAPAVWATIKAAAGATVHVDLPGCLGFGAGCYAEISGTSPSVGVLYA